VSQAIDQEIRALRAHFWSARDPEGRAFAPLADAYRRRGDLDEAHALVDDGLARLPDFTPGHLVAARIHRARGDLERARTSLDALLDLDGENVLALLDRAELSRDTGDRDLAVRDLSTLLKLVPGHLGARSALDALEREGGGEAGSTDAPEAPVDVEQTEVTHTAPGIDAQDLGVEDRWYPDEVVNDLDLVPNDLDLESFASDASDAPGALADFEITSLEVDRDSTEDQTAEDQRRIDLDPGIAFTGEDAELAQEPRGAPDLTEVSGEPGGDADAVADLDVFDFDLGFDAGGTTPSGEGAAAPSDELHEGDHLDDEGLRHGGGEPAALHDSDRSGGGDDLPAHVTRTMAEIFVRQGFPDRAIEVYRKILEREPDDPRILDRIAELKGEGQPPREAVALPADDPVPAGDDEPALERVAPQWAASESDLSTDHEPVTPFGWTDDETENPRDRETTAPPGGTDVPLDSSQLSIRSHFADLLAWVPGGVPIEDLAPDAPIERAPAGSPAVAAAPHGNQEARGGVEPAVASSEEARRGSAEIELQAEPLETVDPDPLAAAEEDEDLDEFRTWLESLEP